MCNNNCCTCCQCGTHDDDTPQEITYTSVCNSDVCKDKDGCRCCCCKNKGVCEDDPNIRLDGMEERMEECCEEVNERITNLECELCEEISRSTTKDEEHDEKIEDLYERESLDFNKSVFNHETLMIEFWHVFPDEDHKDPIHYSEWDIDASNFLKDWFIDDAKLISNRYLELTFNNDPITDPDHNPIKITIDLYDFIDPGLYYTKTEIDNKITQINNAINTISTNLTNLKNSINGYNPELPYDGTAVTVGQIDGKQFKVHLATFPELVQTVSPDYANNRFAVTTNKGNTNYVELKNSTYETIQHAANTYETINHASTTYETKVEAGNHYDRASISGRRITLTKVNGDTTPIDLPEDLLVKQNNCVDDAAIPVLLAYSSNPTSGTSAQAYYSGVTINPHTTIINGIADKAIKDDDGNNISDTYVSGGSFNNSNRNLTLVNPAGVTLATINIPDADTDTNKYVVSGAVNNNNQLTLTYNDGTTTQPIDLSRLVVTDHYVTSGTVTNGVLKLTRQGVDGTVDITLPEGADGDHYPTKATLDGNTLTISGNTGFSPFSVDLSGISGTTNVTYGGHTVTIQQAITNIENRLNALEGLWEINPNDSTQVVAKNNRSAKAAGFYDSTVNTV